MKSANARLSILWSAVVTAVTMAAFAIPAGAQDAGTWSAAADAGAGDTPTQATDEPDCDGGRSDCSVSCNIFGSPTYCDFDCPTSDDYIIFGEVWTSGTSWPYIYGRAGIGVCLFESDGAHAKGTYVSYTVAPSNVVDYRIRADGTSAAGGNDLVRLADPDTFETCRAHGPGVRGVIIKAVLEESDTFLFWGDGGDDHLHLCSYTYNPAYSSCSYQQPASADCLANSGRADGRGNEDHVYGSRGSDWLWGGNDDDYICGYHGNDWVSGGAATDVLYGGCDDDGIEGSLGSDALYGDDAGCADGYDWLFGDIYGGGDDGTDWCQCGGSYYSDYCYDDNCENATIYCSTSCP